MTDTTIEIQNNRVFVNGKETVDPMLIGLAVLDCVENESQSTSKFNFNDKEVAQNNFDFDDIVFLKHDPEQYPRMVISMVIDKNSVMYELASATVVSKHYSSEMSKTKTFYQ